MILGRILRGNDVDGGNAVRQCGRADPSSSGQWILDVTFAAWRDGEDSAHSIFGDSLGDSMADEIRAALGEAGDRGLTRTDISDLFKRNRSRAEIERALELLAECGMARMRPEPTAGRQSERWLPT